MAKELKVVEENLPTKVDIEDILAEYAGAGTSSAPEHNIVPLLYVLQSNSPAVNKRGDGYVDGAEPGDIWLRNGASPIVKGDVGVMFQPVMFQWSYVEWKPNRGGLVAVHDKRPTNAVQRKLDPSDDRLSWVTPDGNTVVDTCYVYGLIDFEEPYVIPLSSSGYRVARGWNSQAQGKKHEKTGKLLPAFATKWRLKTKFKTNDRGDWFILDPVFEEGQPTVQQVINGLQFFKSISSGERKAEAESVASSTVDEEIPF
jgi:hypothetical protein